MKVHILKKHRQRNNQLPMSRTWSKSLYEYIYTRSIMDILALFLNTWLVILYLDDPLTI